MGESTSMVCSNRGSVFMVIVVIFTGVYDAVTEEGGDTHLALCQDWLLLRMDCEKHVHDEADNLRHLLNVYESTLRKLKEGEHNEHMHAAHTVTLEKRKTSYARLIYNCISAQSTVSAPQSVQR